MPTATVARIRRCIRESEFAVAQNPAILQTRPDAKPERDDSFTIDSFFDNTAHAQVMLNERFAVLSAPRLSEAAESDEPMLIGIDVPIAPTLPLVRMVDSSRGLNRVMLIKGLAVDMQTDRNSIEAIG